MRKTMPDLRHIIRRLGGDSPATEGKESLVSRILLFQPQEWKPEKLKVRVPIEPVSREELERALLPYIQRGLRVTSDDSSWYMEVADRKDSGSLKMPLAVIVRTAQYLMPRDM